MESETNKKEHLETTILIYKGTFSENGKLFNGRTYKLLAPYEGNNESNSNRYTPRVNYNFSKQETLSDSLVAEGGGIFIIPDNYLSLHKFHNHGFVQDHVRRLWSDNFKTYEGYYNKGFPEKVSITYKANDVIKKYTGSIAYSGEFVLGRAEYTDGSTYEGGFFENKFYGPGIYTGPDSKKLQGIWEEGVLVTKKDIQLPAHLFTLQTTSATPGSTFNFTFGEEVLPASFAAGSLTGSSSEPVLITIKDGFYYGEIKDGKPHGTGFPYRSKNTEDSDRYREVKTERTFSGSFTNGWLTNGAARLNMMKLL